MTAMKRCRECWVDWQRFQDNESDMFKNNDTRQTHGAAQDTVKHPGLGTLLEVELTKGAEMDTHNLLYECSFTTLPLLAFHDAISCARKK